jgi:hypothetical protein
MAKAKLNIIIKEGFTMRKFLIAAVALAASVSYAVPTATYVGKITFPASYNGSFPATIDFYNADQSLVVGLFNARKVVKVTDPLGTPAVTELADLSGDFPWQSGRGISGINIDQASGNIFGAGDPGVNGGAFILSPTGTKLLIGNPANRMTSLAKFNDAGTTAVGSYVLSSSLRTYDVTQASMPQISVTGVFSSPYNANIRDIAVNSGYSRIYYSRNGTTNDGYAVVQDPTPGDGDISGLMSTGIYQATGTNAIGAMGVGLWEVSGKEYLLVPDVSGKKITIIDVDTASPGSSTVVLHAGDSTIFSTIRDACVGKIGNTYYLFATDVGTATEAEIEIFQLSEFATVGDWSLY